MKKNSNSNLDNNPTVNAQALAQSFLQVEPAERLRIRETLHDMAMAGDCDALIQSMYLQGMYTEAQRDDWYATKRWYQEMENEEKE